MGGTERTRELADMGYKLTRQRRAILEVLVGTSKHLTAEQVYQRVRKRCEGTNLATVYRNLGLMAGEGLIGKVEVCGEPTRFEANASHHHHLICLGCGRVEEIAGCPVHLDEQALASVRFRLVSHRFEAFGYCAGCGNEELVEEDGK
ncbi:MAG: transcriptional repressor [Firmicutes bacterium]|nr:transcriptional repressor [Bacillota bacterium]